MAAGQLLVDETTRTKLGEQGLQEVAGHLWPGDCQTCGHALDGQPPALCIDDTPVFTQAGLHHQRCRDPQWNDSGHLQVQRGALLSWSSRAVKLPLRGKNTGLDLRPMLLVNPGLEEVFIERDAQQQWTVRPHRLFTDAGLVPLGQVVVDRPISGAIARITQDSLEVTMSVSTQTYSCGLLLSEQYMLDRSRELEGVLLGVTHAIHPDKLDDQTLYQLLQSGKMIVGWVPLHGTAPPATPRTVSEQVAGTYVLHWAGRHVSVGRLLGATSRDLTVHKAQAWATRTINAGKATLLPWEPVADDKTNWYTMNPLSVQQYFLRRHSEGWQLVEGLSRMDGTSVETDNEAKAWAAGVLEHQAGISGVTWRPGPTTPGANTLYAHVDSQT